MCSRETNKKHPYHQSITSKIKLINCALAKGFQRRLFSPAFGIRVSLFSILQYNA